MRVSFKTIVVIIITIILNVNCKNESIKQSNNDLEVEINYDTALIFKPEVGIDWFTLRMPEAYYQSFKEYIEGGQRFKPDTLENKNRVVGFLSFNRDEKLELIMYPSDSSYSFSVIQLRKATKEESLENSGLFGLYKDPLMTKNEIKIGTTKDEIISKIGKPMRISKTDVGEQLEYSIEGQHIFLKKHKTNRYFLYYELTKNKVNKVRFGFEKYKPK